MRYLRNEERKGQGGKAVENTAESNPALDLAPSIIYVLWLRKRASCVHWL